jgi:pyrroloquinoline quinone biosynthesis protein B
MEPDRIVLFDGTFWSNDEPMHIPGLGRTALEIGPLPVFGPGGSLDRLAALSSRKIYIHINNTNPMLDEESSEYRRVRDCGWEIACDGMEIVL